MAFVFFVICLELFLLWRFLFFSMFCFHVCFKFFFAIENFTAFFTFVLMFMRLSGSRGFTWNRYISRRPFRMIRWGRHRRYTGYFRGFKSQSYHQKQGCLPHFLRVCDYVMYLTVSALFIALFACRIRTSQCLTIPVLRQITAFLFPESAFVGPKQYS